MSSNLNLFFSAGWVKTFDNYFTQQTRHILNNMLDKLEQYPTLKVIYAEISFFHLWWNELDDGKKSRVRKYVNVLNVNRVYELPGKSMLCVQGNL